MTETRNVGQWMILALFSLATIVMMDMAFAPAPSLFAG